MVSVLTALLTNQQRILYLHVAAISLEALDSPAELYHPGPVIPLSGDLSLYSVMIIITCVAMDECVHNSRPNL
jgi:hypothetical protein